MSDILINYGNAMNGRQDNRNLVVQAALELLKAESSSGERPMFDASKECNPVKDYADYIEEALKVGDKKPT